MYATKRHWKTSLGGWRSVNSDRVICSYHFSLPSTLLYLMGSTNGPVSPIYLCVAPWQKRFTIDRKRAIWSLPAKQMDGQMDPSPFSLLLWWMCGLPPIYLVVGYWPLSPTNKPTTFIWDWMKTTWLWSERLHLTLVQNHHLCINTNKSRLLCARGH